MGQSTSRRREPSITHAHTPTPTTESQMSVDSAGPSSLSSRGNSQTRYVPEGLESRRSSTRRGILDLVRSNNIRRRVSGALSTHEDSRRSWRHSKRWSKAPVMSTPSYDEPSPSSSSLPVAGPSNIDKGKQPERNSHIEDEDDDEYHEAMEEQSQLVSLLPDIVLPTDHTISELQAEHSLTDPVRTESQEQELHVATEIPLENSPQPSTTPNLHRQFPPPGTLVIVQGVVHTTDISRNNTQPEVDDITRTRSRDRFSSLLRPSRPLSSIHPDPLAIPPPSQSPEFVSNSTLERPTSPAQIIDEPVRPISGSQSFPSTPAENSEIRLPSISSSSIDVLGTLLSVAAAATAASLLTGSSEPILSTGMAPPQSTPTFPLNPAPPPPQMTRIPPPPPDVLATSRSDRMRQAWSTIRERLGLRPSIPHLDTPIATDDVFPPPAGEGPSSVPSDARELMLTEMARAFNIGLGLNGLNGTSSSDESGPVNASADTGSAPGNPEVLTTRRAGESNVSLSASAANEGTAAITMPPEGSFERFLVDLQLDLRVALTHVREDSGQNADTVTSEQLQEAHALSNPLHYITPSASNSQSAGYDTTPATTNQAFSPVEARLYPAADSRESSDSDSDSMPNLLDADESDSDSDGDEDFHSAVRSDEGRPQDQEDSRSHNGTSASGMGRIDASGRINWWRLYRFPQITSLGLDLSVGLRQMSATANANSGLGQNATHNPFFHSPSASTFTNATSPSAMSDQLPRPSTSDFGNAPSHENLRTSEPSIPPVSENPSSQTLRSVVPVIIVGLQSVHPEWRPDGPSPVENDDPFGSNDHHTDQDFAGSEDDITFAHNTGDPGPHGRPRGWQSRAADAIRNLRPSRRNPNAGRDTAPSPFSSPSGSRTFLIYVIGGYYPPDHSIVTGGPNNFDSFEALLELADLLGQVKSSTVSKEEIEKSGLEVVKASLLAQYHKENKITANCLDRCLVCLEDYQPDEDVRVMKCRHAFHQACVDEWMQKGRNNCPTCRSTGVQPTAENLAV